MIRPSEVEVRAVAPGDLLDWTGRDRVVAAEFSPDVTLPALAVHDGTAWGAVFVRRAHTRGISLMVHGDDGSGELVAPRVVAVLRGLVASPPFPGWLATARAKGVAAVSLPRTAEGLGGLLARPPGRWEWMSTTSVPEVGAGVDVRELGVGVREEVRSFLDAHNPGTDGQPFVRSGQRWLGVRSADGRLLAVGCCEPERSGTPVLSGITVHPVARGRGLGRAVTAELTRAAIAEHGWCTLGMYSVNDIARRMYLSLGYVIGACWSSGELS
ncbi:GNAT family N-acetyltransferase [Janibacter sp. GS2]|uniref:GNAT family N-acetyltransferase n=1 Tax=Janibacter sp. GS2 TaxID=3442646 RepID=UPI003EB6AA25